MLGSIINLSVCIGKYKLPPDEEEFVTAATRGPIVWNSNPIPVLIPIFWSLADKIEKWSIQIKS